MFRAHAFTAAAAVVLSASLASAALVTSFETGAPGSNAFGGTGVVVNSGDGITDGAQAYRATLASGQTFQKVFQAFPDAAGVYSNFTLDLFYANTNASTGYNGARASLFVSSDQQAGQSIQLDAGAEKIARPDDAAVSPSNPSPNEFLGADGQYTLRYNLSDAQRAIIAGYQSQTNPGIKFELFANKAGTRLGSYTVDNLNSAVVAVPEPVSAAALALGGVVLAARRRRSL